MHGRTALVTGGGTGIGRAIAQNLSRLGARVAITGRREDALKETVATATGPQMVSVSCDIREPEQVDRMLDEVLSELGHIDYLVNNAGGQFVSPAEKISHKGFRAVTRLNLDATWYVTTQVAVRSMLPNSYGKVVSITMTPRTGMPGMSHSSAARAAVESLMRTLSLEWGPRGIRLVAIAPGLVHTDAWERYGVDPGEAAETIPLRHLQSVDDVAALAAFLLSPAGDYITGTTIVADGGFELPNVIMRKALS